LLYLLRNLGPDILIATHSTEIITEADADEIVLINKKKKQAYRIKQPSELAEVFAILGSNLNPVLTQLAKSRRALFVEGKDFQILGKFARKLSYAKVSNRSEFAVIPVEGFNPERIKNFKKGIEATLGVKILAAAILDRDYRSQAECESISRACKDFCDLVQIHDCKEIENFLLSPAAIDRAAERRVLDRSKRSGGSELSFVPCARSFLYEFSNMKKTYVTSQLVSSNRQYLKCVSPAIDEATATESALSNFELRRSDGAMRFAMVPGKDALSFVNEQLQKRYKVTVTPSAIIDALKNEEVPESMKNLIRSLDEFTQLNHGQVKGQ